MCHVLHRLTYSTDKTETQVKSISVSAPKSIFWLPARVSPGFEYAPGLVGSKKALMIGQDFSMSVRGREQGSWYYFVYVTCQCKITSAS